MSTVIAVAQFVTTTTGSADITTTDLGGLTPKGALFIAGSALSNNTAADQYMHSIGAADGTRQWADHGSSEHNVSRTNNGDGLSSTQCLALDQAGATSQLRAEFTTFIANGCTINITDADLDFLCTVVFFAGTDVSCYAAVNTAFAALAQDASTDITDPGFQPDVVFTAINSTTGNGTMSNTFGVTANQASVMQAGIGVYEVDNAGDGACQTYITDAYSAYKVAPVAALLSAFDASGFTATKKLGASAEDLAYLAVKVGTDIDVWAGVVDSKASTTGDLAYTGPNFKPQFVMLGPTYCTATASLTNLGTWGVGAASGVDDEYSTSWQAEYGSATTDTQSMADAVLLNLPIDAGSAGLVANLKSFDATGFTLTYTAVDASARKMLALAIEAETAGLVGQIATVAWASVGQVATVAEASISQVATVVAN